MLSVAFISSLLVGTVTERTPTDPAAWMPTPLEVAVWREHVLPTAEESRWESIPWIPSFSGGLLAAQEQGRPFVFWAMNGHPLGCT